MDARKISELKDRKNILYVALTRAVEGLIILRKPKDSIFDEINMGPMSVGEHSNKMPIREYKRPSLIC